MPPSTVVSSLSIVGTAPSSGDGSHPTEVSSRCSPTVTSCWSAPTVTSGLSGPRTGPNFGANRSRARARGFPCWSVLGRAPRELTVWRLPRLRPTTKGAGGGTPLTRISPPGTPWSTPAAEQHYQSGKRQDREHEEEDLHPAFRITPGDGAGVAVDQHMVGRAVVLVG